MFAKSKYGTHGVKILWKDVAVGLANQIVGAWQISEASGGAWRQCLAGTRVFLLVCVSNWNKYANIIVRELLQYDNAMRKLV